MESIILQSKSKQDIAMLARLAKKMGLKAHILSRDEREDAALLAMMQQRKRDEVVPVSKTLEILDKIK